MECEQQRSVELKKETGTQAQTDRSDRYRQTEIEKQTERGGDRTGLTETETERDRQIQTETETKTKTNGEKDRDKQRQRQQEKGTETETPTEIDRKTDRHIDKSQTRSAHLMNLA